MKHRAERSIPSADGARRLVVIESEDGLCSYVVEAWFAPYDEDERRCIGDGYWHQISFSGLYASADAAEADARRALPWLRPEPQPED